MPSDSPSLFSIARNKLQSVVGGNARDSDSLHRWVLLKNSIVRTAPSPAALSSSAPARVHTEPVHKPLEGSADAEQDAFMFPDPDMLLGYSAPELGPREDLCLWLDSVLEDLGDDEDDDNDVELVMSASLPPAQEDDEPLSPLYSPMSSSDDLVLPYPPLHPPLIPSWFEPDNAAADPNRSSSPPLYHDPLPYCDVDDLEDLPVPDAIEDTSDDESDAPSTPALTSTSSLSSSSSPPTPARERTRLPNEPRIYIDKDDTFFAPFEFESLPFPSDERPHHGVRGLRRPICQEC
ncbi:hypothetical protein EIP91_010220 [Steccherinum ochraceum]|uniref:Uncharacterized protein n=1 Tax=Steccherinum ochraceum TaxID=92696 RepID=A0A4R0R690_9APHY|nr:hypothetical protein EIP91_010220 [Steccherinum ochraceum]